LLLELPLLNKDKQIYIAPRKQTFPYPLLTSRRIFPLHLFGFPVDAAEVFPGPDPLINPKKCIHGINLGMIIYKSAISKLNIFSCMPSPPPAILAYFFHTPILPPIPEKINTIWAANYFVYHLWAINKKSPGG
jgi:hypothetical protein